MGKKLLIVESPAKAKTIGKYLGGAFVVKSSIGHIRDLPGDDKAIEISPAGDGRWTFKPTYTVSPGKTKVVSELKKAARESDEIYLASDPDREGEAIAWHLESVLKSAAAGKPFRRVTYNEITKDAVLKAVAAPRDIDMPLVDAQQARRILDRIVGYKVSPLLWRNIHCPGSRSLSAGRVQSVALRLLVERQKEIDSFTPQTYWLVGVEAAKNAPGAGAFTARLARIDGKKKELNEKIAVDAILLDLAGAKLEVAGLKAQPRARRPLPPFTTSTMQQAASSVLAFSPGRTMKLAQSLYEQGLITYMRTDSVNVSETARNAAKAFIVSNFGGEYYPSKPNFYKSKADAQGAHEAIRPTDAAAAPAATGLDGAELKLYDLIWRRFIASQMADARTTQRTATLEPRKDKLAHRYEFTASATDVDFDGFLKVMHLQAKPKAGDQDGDEADSDEVASLPPLETGETLSAARWLADEKQTKGPAHYSEASLVKALEENGVGRPSTYAATIETLKEREYAKNDKRKLVPLEKGVLVSNWLTAKLDGLFNVGYTARMEAELDKVESGGVTMDAMLSSFYGKFLADIAACADPGVDASNLDGVFEALSHVREWTEPRKSGGRTYDDKAFVESVKRQRDAGKKISERQFGFLVRMVRQYASQIPGAEEKLKAWNGGAAAAKGPDPALVKLCFDAVARLDGLPGNKFVKSVREQYERGRELSERQFAVLARTVGEHCSRLDDAGAIREKLAAFLPKNASQEETDPAAPELLEEFKAVEKWRDRMQRGKKTFDDKEFVESLAAQYASKGSLSSRQCAALRRVASAYREQLPHYADIAAKYGFGG